jgi:hypothetical protein
LSLRPGTGAAGVPRNALMRLAAMDLIWPMIAPTRHIGW